MASSVTAVVSRFMDLPRFYVVTVGAESVGPIRLREVRAAAADLVDDPDADIEVVFPPPLDDLVSESRATALVAEQAVAAAQDAKLRVIDEVTGDGESEATAGVVLGVTRQRVQQLLATRAARQEPDR
ncbi:hypothetical protein [Tsukamurella columbiensis]|uniref:Uncharacterized protein n=1 Tax=Tsukamurella columbiensis TaxID=128509 RepID=A0ABX1LM33_9ACTN|nr:hypothetical protein [Tsukamurella columbiensis]NMD58310.1 hypothetical protein [Tsukamurella columbiensis]